MEDMKKQLEPVDGWKLLMQSVHEAMAEATRENIKVNSIVINENMVKVKQFLIPHGMYAPASKVMGPMICGLNVYFTADELPDGYSFALVEGAERKPELDICGAIDYIYERTWIDQAVLQKVLELAAEYMEVKSDDGK